MRSGARTALYAIGGIGVFSAALVIATMWAFAYGIFAANVQAQFAKRTLAPRITQTIYTPANALAAYTRFRSDCRDVVAKSQQVTIQQQRVSAAKLELSKAQDAGAEAAASSAYQNAVDDLVALQQSQVTVAEGYNARAANFAFSTFQALGGNDPPLPYRITPPYNALQCG